MRGAGFFLYAQGPPLLQGLPDEVWTKISIEFYADPTDGVFRALME